MANLFNRDASCDHCLCFQCSPECEPQIIYEPLDHQNCTKFKGDGQCDDKCNHIPYDFDGGDCCLDVIDDTFCTDCFCYGDCTNHEAEPNQYFVAVDSRIGKSLGT